MGKSDSPFKLGSTPGKVRRLKIRGDNWKLIYGRPPANDCASYCDPNVPRRIWIRPSENKTLREQRRCVLHEILHACFYDLKEEAIEEAEDALDKGLELIGL